MLLRNGALSGGSTGQLQVDRRQLFEEGVTLVFRRWTALLLALDMQWGGPQSSEKAQAIYEDTISWFYANKGVIRLNVLPKPPLVALPNHYSDDLGVMLEDAMEQDFHARLEDGSPYEVAKALVLMHNELLHGDTASLDRLRKTASTGPSGSFREKVDADGTIIQGNVSSSDSSSSDDGDADESMETSQDAASMHAASTKTSPVIDDEGFELVQRRKPRGRGGQPNS